MSIELALELAQHNAVTARLPEAGEFGRIADLLKWQPISTAPKDSDILAYCPAMGVQIAWMDEGQWLSYEGDVFPTHWMALPGAL